MKLSLRSYAPVASLALLAAIWGYNWVVMKKSLQFIGPFDFNAVRMAMGAIVLLGFMACKGLFRRPSDGLLIALLGFSQTAAGTGLIVWALMSGGAGKTAILVYTMPFWIMIFAWVFLGEKFGGVYWIPVVASFAGLVFLLEPWSLEGTFVSKILAVLAGVCWGIGAIIIKTLQKRPGFDLLSVTTWQTFFGALPLVVAAFLIPSKPIVWTPYLLGAMAYNGFLVSALAFILYIYVIRKLPAGVGGMGLLAIPVIGMAASWIELGERINDWEAGGILLILAALATLSLLRLKEGQQVGVDFKPAEFPRHEGKILQ